jgi:hypothetical protein
MGPIVLNDSAGRAVVAPSEAWRPACCIRGMAPEVVVITGASAGVDRATARRFGHRKAKIGLLARGREGLERARQENEASGGGGRGPADADRQPGLTPFTCRTL